VNNMSFMELVQLTQMAMKLDKIADKYGVIKSADMYYALRETAAEIYDMVQTELKQKRV